MNRFRLNRARAAENTAYVVAANQGASLEHYPPFSWPGGSMVVDYDGRILAQADPGPGEKIVVAPIDIDALRREFEAPEAPFVIATIGFGGWDMAGNAKTVADAQLAVGQVLLVFVQQVLQTPPVIPVNLFVVKPACEAALRAVLQISAP